MVRSEALREGASTLTRKRSVVLSPLSSSTEGHRKTESRRSAPPRFSILANLSTSDILSSMRTEREEESVLRNFKLYSIISPGSASTSSASLPCVMFQADLNFSPPLWAKVGIITKKSTLAASNAVVIVPNATFLPTVDKDMSVTQMIIFYFQI